jgi:hypothetical protein
VPEDLTTILWLTHLATTLFLVGLIWVVQVVHYPLFAHVGASQFHEYWRGHTRLITWLVAPSMFAEVVSAVLLFAVRPHGLSLPVLVVAFGLLALNWLSTWLVQIPLHERLGRQFDPTTLRRLVLTNWVRTAAWTFRGVLVLTQTYCLLRASVPVEQ